MTMSDGSGRTSQPMSLYALIRACELFGALVFVQFQPAWMPLTWFALMTLADTWGAWRVTRRDFRTLPFERRRRIYRQCIWQSTAMVGSAVFFLYVPGNYVAHSLLGIYLTASGVIVAMWGVRDVLRTGVAVGLILVPTAIRMGIEGMEVGRGVVLLLSGTGLGFAAMIVYTTKLYADRMAIEHALRVQAERASEAMANVSLSKSRFFAAVSHDLRQPVHAIGLYLDPLIALSEVTANDTVVRSVHGIRNSWRILDDLLSQVLDLTRLDAGTVETRMESIELVEAVRSVVVQHSAAAERSGVRLVVLMNAGIRVWADELMLKRVLSNLVDNAIKFSGTGQRVVVCARRRGDAWRVEVRDAGPGIPLDAQEGIFEEFVQVGNDGRDRQNGYGLGLAIARRFMRLMGGDLDVVSRPGHGCSMRMILRSDLQGQREHEAPSSAQSDKSVQPLETEGVALRSRSVLLVEDDPLVADAMTQLLESRNIAVHRADNAAEALMQAGSATVAICDVRLPDGISGIDLAVRLRGAGFLVLLVTGETGAEVAAAAEGHGLPMLKKPVASADLLRALKSLEDCDTVPVPQPLGATAGIDH